MHALLTSSSRFRRARHGRSGFTLVELMVAMTGGLFLSLAVMALSRDFSRFSLQQMRISNATLASANGFDRMVNDLARAGHLVTPNIEFDPRVCNKPVSGWPSSLGQLRAVVLNTAGTSVANTEVSRAGITPMSITIAGALDMAEELTITAISSTNNQNFVGIRVDTPAAARIGLSALPAKAASNAAILGNIFLPGGVGRAIRISQNDGLEQYAVVTAINQNPLQLQLATTPAIQFRANANAAQCGVLGHCTGCTVNVINFVRYEMRSLVAAPGDYALLFAASADANLPYEAGRVELMRDELTPAGTVLAGTSELVAEYATDLQFTISQATSPTIRNLITPAPAAINATYPSTQLIRGIRARLSVRSREADRGSDVVGAATGQYRIQLTGSGGSSPEQYGFARIRSLQADVALRNTEGANW